MLFFFLFLLFWICTHSTEFVELGELDIKAFKRALGVQEGSIVLRMSSLSDFIFIRLNILCRDTHYSLVILIMILCKR